MFLPMTPRIEDSIVRTKHNQWLLGSLYVCETAQSVPNHAVSSWEVDGNIYYIREMSTDEQESIKLGDSASNRIHHAGTSAAVWNIGGTFVKVKAWRQGMQLESDTIQFVNSISSIPTPEVVFSWVDATIDRSFLVLKALEGQTLDQAWDLLSADQHKQIARTVAKFCKALASKTSKKLQTAHGHGVLEPFLLASPPDTEPSWRPQLLGPYSSDELRSYLSGSPILESHLKSFHFSHADLGPTNIIVAEDGSVVAIIDWESAAFYPLFWLGTKPLLSAGFLLHGAERLHGAVRLQGAERWAWAVLLAESLKQEGFPSDTDTYQAWRKAVGK